MKCFRCGVEIPAGSRFCAECGTQVSDPFADTVAVTTEIESPPDQLLADLRRHLTGDFEVHHELGRGGMAVVFKATECALGRDVAIKVLPPDVAQAQTMERFKREARMAAQLDHQNIIPIYRVGQAGAMLYIAMKYVEGRALDEIVGAQGALSIPVVLACLRDTASALAFAHRRDIIHRDIKGANILIERDGRIMVSDFGIARAAADKTLTATGAVVGTPQFMSPEQCAGERLGPQSDQYSLGVVAFQLLSGEVPFDADSVMGIMHHHFFTPVPDIRDVREDVPEPLVAALDRMMAKQPEQRYDSTDDLLDAIESIASTEADRKASGEQLCRLAQGERLPLVRTGSLPPLPATRTQAMKPVEISRKPHRSRTRRTMGLVTVAAAAAATLVYTRLPLPRSAAPALLEAPRESTAVRRDIVSESTAVAGTSVDSPTSQPIAALALDSPPPRTGTVDTAPAPRPGRGRAAPQPLAEPVGEGRLRIRVTPPSAVLFVDQDSVGTGFVFDLAVSPGLHRVRAAAVGYVSFDTTIVVEVGATISLTNITLRGEGGRL